MIYELALVAKAELPENELEALSSMVKDVLSEGEGELFIEDDWGKLNFAQPSSKGVRRGLFKYFIFKLDPKTNKELTRRIRINEGILKSLLVKLGEVKEQDELIKAYKTPYSKKYKGSATSPANTEEGQGADLEKDKKRFARRKSCWFTAKRIKADWKDPTTYSWLINEFGKISPARVTGVSRRHQRIVNRAIKRARQIGMVSHLSNRLAE
ncbi:30S ribosomal protein S18 [Bacteriovoracales bacterium]|nr:30S ribosomal protein S18 [Bacteriovoracales bacterium]